MVPETWATGKGKTGTLTPQSYTGEAGSEHPIRHLARFGYKPASAAAAE